MTNKERSLAIIETLHPAIREKAKAFYQTCEFAKKPILIYCGMRTPNEQAVLYAQGRTTEGKIVTYAKPYQSWHNFALAFDFCLLDKTGTKSIWNTSVDLDNNKISDWMEVIKIAKELGFESGIDFKNQDAPHLQMRFGLTTSQAYDRILKGKTENGFIKIV